MQSVAARVKLNHCHFLHMLPVGGCWLDATLLYSGWMEVEWCVYQGGVDPDWGALRIGILTLKSKFAVPREDVAFQTADNVTLRGWFYRPDSSGTESLPCLVMAHGFSAIKEMDLDVFAEYFVSHLALACLVYDNRGFGDSDTKDGSPRQETIPAQQTSDYSDAITYAQSRSDVNADKIAVWGSSYSGGHALWVGAVDRRVKAVLSQVPFVDGWANFNRLIRSDLVGGLNHLFQEDRLARAAGKPAGTLPVVDEDPLKPSALPTPDSHAFFAEWTKNSTWKNEATVKKEVKIPFADQGI